MLSFEELGNNPRVWLKIPGYVVRNYSPDLEESLVQHMKNIFLTEEPIFSSCGINDDPTAMKELDKFCRYGLGDENLSLIALPENTPGADLRPVEGVISLAGVNVLFLRNKDDPPPSGKDFTSVPMRKALDTFAKVSKVDFFKHFDVDKLVVAAGLGVHPSHRGRGIGQALIQARFPLCEAIGVHVTKTMFTSVPAQKIALRCGFQIFHTVKYSDIKNEKGELVFPNIPPENTIIVTARRI